MKLFRKRFRLKWYRRRLQEYRYEIQQRHTILFVIHFWTTPEFEPPHSFGSADMARQCILDHHPDAIINPIIEEE